MPESRRHPADRTPRRLTRSGVVALALAMLVAITGVGSLARAEDPPAAPGTPSRNAADPRDRLAPPPIQTMGTGIDEKLGAYLPLDAEFIDSTGKTIHLSDYFGKDQVKPAIIAMVYYHCPVTCTAVMEKLAQCMNQMDLTLGKDYRVLMFSIAHSERAEDAARLRAMYAAGYDRVDEATALDGWRWHVGNASENRRLADALGFKYKMLDDGHFSHPVAIFMSTPDGRVSRYIYGWEYVPRDVKLALMESASGRLTKSIGDRLLAFCYMFDPKAGSYTLQAIRVMQIGGLLTLLALTILIVGLFAWEKRRRGVKPPAPSTTTLPPGAASAPA